jgi:protease-4
MIKYNKPIMSKKYVKISFFVLSASLCLSATRTAGAQSIYERVLMPPAGLSSGGDPFLIALNPASMGLNVGWEGAYYHSELKSQDAIAGNGDAIYLTSPALWIFHLGFGFESVRPVQAWKEHWFVSEGRQTGNWSMLTFALAARLGDVASIGASLRTYVADENETFHRLTTWDAGIHLHPSPYMSLAMSVIDISTPKLPGLEGSIERTWGVGIAIRPLGRDILTLSFDNLMGQTSRNDILRGFVEVKPIRGLAIQALMEMWLGDSGFMDDQKDFAFQASLGLRFELPYVGVFGAAHMGNRIGSPYLGFTVGVRISGQYYLSLIMPKRLIKIDLDGSLDGEEAVELLLYLDAVRKEPSIRGVVLEMKGFEAMPGLVQDIVDAIDRMKEGGKQVFCYEAGLGSSASTYACSHATAYYFSPVGGTMIAGSKMRIFYYTGLLKKLGVNAQIFRIGDYKSFPETVTLEGPSEKAAEEYKDVLKDIYDGMTADIAQGRKFGNGASGASSVIAGGPYNSNEAVEKNLADGVIWEDQLRETIEKKIGKKVILSKQFDFSTKAPDKWTPGRRIGVVVISGTMVDGKSRKIPLLGFETAGSETIVDALDAAAKNPSIAAVVLRVDSGGGSAVAAEKIWRAVEQLAEKKPVVASFGSVAASGGYYAAVSADEIYAEPSTITGSIGIFMGKADLSELLKKIGINVAVFKEGGEKADMNAFYRPYTDEEIDKIKSEINYVYNIFLNRVSKGRKMDKSAVHDAAQGRIWSGMKAKQKGLVSKTGSFLDAVDRARKLAKLPSWAPVVSLTKKRPGFLMKVLASSISVDSQTKDLAHVLEGMVKKSDASKVISPLAVTIGSEEPLAMVDSVFLWE